VTGLLQTERYARSLIAQYSKVEPIAPAIGDESVIYEQLKYLVAAAARPNISLRILPLRAPHPVSAESFAIFSFGPTGDAILHDVVTAEGLKESFYIEDRQQTYLHLLVFDTLLEATLDADGETAAPAAGPAWTRSSLSHTNGNCVEVADIGSGLVGMRDSKNTIGPKLEISSEEWRAFLGGVRNGEFDNFRDVAFHVAAR
jgi:hypothetical protein